MKLLVIIIAVFSSLSILATVASLIKWRYDWWIRVFDFPRVQISAIIILMLISSFIVYSFAFLWHFVLTGLLLAALISQTMKIYRYTPFAQKQVLSYKGNDKKNSISILVSNVLQTNRNSEKLLKLIKKYQPDLILTLETDKWWGEQLANLEKEWSYTIKKPLNNLYGMHLFSRFEIKNAKIKNLVKNDIPSFELQIVLKSGDLVNVFCLHPKPPIPSESDTSLFRDAELLIVGKKVEKSKKPILIFGDFNDVAWSHSTRLFQKVSELLDPRIGRGFFNTFHAGYPLFRWPLDHIFHSDHFILIKMKRMKNIGSDHFPIYIELHYNPEYQKEQEEPDADREEMEFANGVIEDAR
jgi:endonuclease/exonuclease/phosphatase (EEP) superfamily protein YafD